MSEIHPWNAGQKDTKDALWSEVQGEGTAMAFLALVGRRCRWPCAYTTTMGTAGEDGQDIYKITGAGGEGGCMTTGASGEGIHVVMMMTMAIHTGTPGT